MKRCLLSLFAVFSVMLVIKDSTAQSVYALPTLSAGNRTTGLPADTSDGSIYCLGSAYKKTRTQRRSGLYSHHYSCPTTGVVSEILKEIKGVRTDSNNHVENLSGLFGTNNTELESARKELEDIDEKINQLNQSATNMSKAAEDLKTYTQNLTQTVATMTASTILEQVRENLKAEIIEELCADGTLTGARCAN